jgi:5-methylcytosine-specific restriction endonuclease McrA
VYCFIQESRLVTRKTFRRAIFEAWDRKCAYCLEDADTLDHVVAKSNGGSTVTENLIPACKRCNGFKSDEEWGEWYRRQAWYCVEREMRIKEWTSSSGIRPQNRNQDLFDFES